MIVQGPGRLRLMDAEITEKFIDNFKRHGGRYLAGQTLRSVKWDGVVQVETELESGEMITADKMLVALGRLANVEHLGLETAGIAQDERGQIRVDENYQTNRKTYMRWGM